MIRFNDRFGTSATRALTRSCEILDVSLEASPETLRAAYLAGVREHPPDSDPERFEDIRAAYEVLSDPRVRRLSLLQKQDDPRALVAHYAERVLAAGRCYPGLEPVLAALEFAPNRQLK
jgi:curved DNA-binding protein CbpA